MTPLRLLLIGLLLYILYRLLVGPRRKKVSRKKHGGAAPGSAVQDVLVEDPVCHTYVPQKQAIRAAKDGKVYYFCSEKCCQTFLTGKGEQQ